MSFRLNSRAVRSCMARWMPAAAVAIGMSVALGSSVPAQTGGGPGDAGASLRVSTDWVLQGVGLIRQYRDVSRRQAGNLEFSVMQETDRPNRFVIVQGWKDQAAFEAHGRPAGRARVAFP